MMRLFLLAMLTFMSFGLQAQNGSKALTLEGIVDGDFREKQMDAMTFMSDGVHYAQLVDGNKIIQYDLMTGNQSSVLLSSDRLNWKGDIAGFSFSDDNNFILFYTDKEQIYRHSYKARYYLYDVRLKQLLPIADEEFIRAAILSPDASKVAYVKNNNIFIYHSGFKTTRQITDDGAVNSVINGVPDWVYEEEFATDRMLEWAPDSRFLAWVRFDESQVPEYSFPLYQQEKGLVENGYLDRYVYKYPKAGAKNSKVSVHIFDYNNKVSRVMKVGDENEDIYIPRIFWTKNADQLGIARLNRHQNDLQILFANPKSGISTIIISEQNERYIDQQSYSNIYFLNDAEHFVYQSEKDGFNHLYLYALSGRLVKQLTTGSYDVTAFYGYDTKAKKYYFQAAKKSPLEREVYSLDAKNKIECITPVAGTNAIQFSPNFSCSFRSYSSVDVPLNVRVFDKKENVLYTVVDNKELKEELENSLFAYKTFMKVVNENGDTLNGWMVKPLAFDAAKQYPVIMTQYSGPGSQQVSNKFAFGWEYYLSQLGYVVVCVDGRGTGFRGEEFKKCTYLQLGRYESDDQIAVAKYLAQLPYIDGHRIGIWGWSYGGFMSSLCMSRGDGIFKAGIAVAPVTHYKFYDSIYTERFMRTPQENEAGYNDYSPLMLADKLQGHLLLCHGTADDNVHYQNTIEYVEALVQANKQFEMQIYRNRNHSIYGGNTRMHLYQRFVNFFQQNL